MKALTDRQSFCLSVIKDSIETRGYPPTLREIGIAMGISSTNGVNDHLRALERKQLIRRNDLKSRAIVVLNWPCDSASATHDPRPPTPGVFIQRKRCLVCATATFTNQCPLCTGAVLEVA